MRSKLVYSGSYSDETIAKSECAKLKDGVIKERKVDGKIRYFVFEKQEQK